MIVDSSALVAVVFREPGHQSLLTRLTAAPTKGIGTPTLVETGIVLTSRLQRDSSELTSRLLAELDIEKVPFGEDHWREALRVYVRFGRGRHPANLNYGDCMAYAVASLARQPLLYVGRDFAATDLEAA